MPAKVPRSRSVKRPSTKLANSPRRAGKAAKAARPVKPTRQPAKRGKAAAAGRAAASPRGAAVRAAAKRAAGKRAAAQRAPVARRRAVVRPVGGRSPGNRWLAFVERHGVVLASARGPVPCVAEAVAGQPIVGSWWAHPKGKAIFAALSELDDADDVRCFKLVDGKVTFVHRRVWPALACLAGNGVIAPARAAAIQQEHMPTGEHRNLITPFPDWVPDDVARAAAELTVEVARGQLGAWV